MTKNKIILVAAALIIMVTAGLFISMDSKSIAPKTLTQGKQGKLKVDNSSFDNWTLSCVKAENVGSKSCRILQRALWEKTKRRAFTTVFMIPANQKKEQVAIMRLIAPLGVNLMSKLNVSIDSGKILNIPYEACNIKGCFITMVVKDKFIEKIKEVTSMHISYRAAGNKNPIKLEIPLKGFTKAYDALLSSNS